jgi:dUTP pyrophosphatase
MYERNVIKIKLDKGAIAPTRGHTWDGGLDLYAMEDGYIRANQSRTFDTGVHLEIPECYVGYIKSRSGLMVNHGITTDGTIDAHYTGPIKVCLFNHGGSKYEVKAGDKIAQLVIQPILLPRLELVDSLEDTDRGANGFGSTGR